MELKMNLLFYEQELKSEEAAVSPSLLELPVFGLARLLDKLLFPPDSLRDYSVKVLGFPAQLRQRSSGLEATLESPRPCQVQMSREDTRGPFYDIINTNTVIKYL